MPLLEQAPGTNKWLAKAHEGQQAALQSKKRIVAVIAGGRAGKTSLGALWLHQEMLRCGPGDYLVAAPSFPLIDKAAGPELEHLFQHVLKLGTMRRSPSWQFVFHQNVNLEGWGKLSRPARIIIGHADDPDTLEAMRAKAAWLDEAGQSSFKQASWEVVQQRLANDSGRVLITSKPYNLGWLKRLVYDPWHAAGKKHSEIDVISFDSRMNPEFPESEYERARATLPAWRFDMMYRGLFTRPAGVIYEGFDTAKHVVKRFRPSPDWPRFIGVDFGAVNTAAVYLAGEMAHGKPTGRYFLYKTYYPAGRHEVKVSPAKHAEAILSGEVVTLSGEPRIPYTVGGSKSEDEARADFGAAGLYVAEPPIKDVEVGIDRVHAMIQQGNLLVFADQTDIIDDLSTYARELNEQGEPTEKIEAKETWHRLDALRYICAHLYRGPDDGWTDTRRKGAVNLSERGAAAGVWSDPTAAVDPYQPERDQWDDRDDGQPDIMRRAF